MKKCVILAMTMMLGCTSLVFSQRRYEGRPEFHAGMPRRFVVWEENGTFVVRATTKEAKGEFRGVIYVHKGVVTDLRGVRLEKGDHIGLSKDRTTIYFRFSTQKGVDGFNFKTTGKKIYGVVHNGARKAPPDEIFLGAKGVHPVNNPFILYAEKDETIPRFNEDEWIEGEVVKDFLKHEEMEKD